MKATGIVRRIDDLGRVVIPKEIRRSMGIREGDPLELFVEGDGICFIPYCKTLAQKIKSIGEELEDMTFENKRRVHELIKELTAIAENVEE
jgi:stage V sporulation protein T